MVKCSCDSSKCLFEDGHRGPLGGTPVYESAVGDNNEGEDLSQGKVEDDAFGEDSDEEEL